MKILSEIAIYLQNTDFFLTKKLDDGRINSSINEGELLQIIKRKYEIDIPVKRSWYDFSISEDNNWYLMKKYGESTKLRADMYFNFKRFFSEYV